MTGISCEQWLQGDPLHLEFALLELSELNEEK